MATPFLLRDSCPQWFYSPGKWNLLLFSLFPHLFAMKWWDQMSQSSFFECWVLSQPFHSPLSPSSRGSSFSAIRVVSSAYFRGLECKSRKSRNTWGNRQIWPRNTEWSRAKTNRVMPRERTGHSKHPLPTTQVKTLYMDITRWSTLKSDWLYSLQPKIEKLYTVSKNKTRSWLWLRWWTPSCQIQT